MLFYGVCRKKMDDVLTCFDMLGKDYDQIVNRIFVHHGWSKNRMNEKYHDAKFISVKKTLR